MSHWMYNNQRWDKITSFFVSGYTTEFRFTQKLATGIQNYAELKDLVDYRIGMALTDQALIFVDNHDNQRGHAGGGM